MFKEDHVTNEINRFIFRLLTYPQLSETLSCFEADAGELMA